MPTDVAEAIVTAVKSGDTVALRAVLEQHPDVAGMPLGGRHGTRTPLHAVTDWPGYFPNGPATVRLLIAAGADPNAGHPGGETPLHWAASSDDVHVAAALIEGGADLDAADGSIGTPLANAVGYACWDVARLLVAAGARIDQPWQAAALGLLDDLDRLLDLDPSPDRISQAFWHACAGGQRRAAERLLDRGADMAWEPDYARGTPLDVAQGTGTQRENLIGWLRERGAPSASSA